MGAVVLLGVAAAFVGLGIALRRNDQRRRGDRAATTEVHVDERGVRRRLADGRQEAVDWDEVVEVEVITTAVGVHRDDGVLLVLGGGDEERGCLLPSRVAVEHGAIPRLHLLPGFDARRLVQAMEAPPPSRTTIWRRAEH